MRVSVCIPTADRPALLREAVASVEAQTYTDIELVVSDNSRDPRNRAENERFLREPRKLSVSIYSQPHPVSQTLNFNTLVDIAEGDLWTLLPDDDRLRPHAVERAASALDAHPECSFTFADHSLLRPDGTVDEVASSANSQYFGRTDLQEGVYYHQQLFQLALRQTMCLQTMMFRRDIIRRFRFDPNVFMCDLSLALRLGSSGDKINAYFIAERIVDYRIHPAQATNEMDRIGLLRNSIMAMKTGLNVPSAHRREYNQKLARSLTALSVAETEIGDSASARSSALEAWTLAPGLRAAVGVVIAYSPSWIFLVRFYRAGMRTKGGVGRP